jgi:hypothetical protein
VVRLVRGDHANDPSAWPVHDARRRACTDLEICSVLEACAAILKLAFAICYFYKAMSRGDERRAPFHQICQSSACIDR